MKQKKFTRVFAWSFTALKRALLWHKVGCITFPALLLAGKRTLELMSIWTRLESMLTSWLSSDSIRVHIDVNSDRRQRYFWYKLRSSWASRDGLFGRSYHISGLSVVKVNNICKKLDLFRKVVLHILILHCDCEALILQNRRGNFEYFSDDEYKHFNYMLICRVWRWNQTFGKSPNMVNQKKYSFPKWHKCDQQPNQGQTKQFLHLKKLNLRYGILQQKSELQTLFFKFKLWVVAKYITWLMN